MCVNNNPFLNPVFGENMTKIVLFIGLMSVFAAACGQSPNTATAEEAIAPPQNTPITSRKAAQNTPTLSNTTVPLPEAPTTPLGRATIQGTNVTMRKEASVKSEKLGSFSAGEQVTVLASKNVDNSQEGILSKPITVQGSGGTVSLNKGKAVVIENYITETNRYKVTYEDPEKGKLTAEIAADAVETINYSTWYQVKRTSGEVAWILGKFLKTTQ